MLSPDGNGGMTAVAVGIAKLGEPAVALQAAKYGGGFVASGRASSVAAGRLSYVNGLKVGVWPYLVGSAVCCCSLTCTGCFVSHCF